MLSILIGTKAPTFTARDQNGHSISLDELKGKKVIIYFYPKDDTPGCTAEACSFRDHYTSFLSEGYTIIGVSTDDEKSHKKFISKYELPFSLLADTDHSLVNAFGVWVEKNMYGKKYMGVSRETFILDEQGIITHHIKKVDTKNATKQIRDLLDSSK
jgi:thioredoxin-dependent peroxiredoxin